MSRSLRRGAVAAVIIATAPILAACSAGSDAASLQVKPDSASTSITNGSSSLKLNAITVVTDAQGQAPASVVVNIANVGNNADTLTGVTVNGVQAVISGSASIPSQGSLLLGGPGQPSATVPTLDAAPGRNATVSFTFSSAGSVQITALIHAGSGDYASYAPSPSPTPTPSATATPAATATGTAKATATGTGKATATATATKH